MGNSKSKHGEKLDENNAAYFAKVQKRNSTSNTMGKTWKKSSLFLRSSKKKKKKKLKSSSLNHEDPLTSKNTLSSNNINNGSHESQYIFPVPGPLQKNTMLSMPAASKKKRHKKRKKKKSADNDEEMTLDDGKASGSAGITAIRDSNRKRDRPRNATKSKPLDLNSSYKSSNSHNSSHSHNSSNNHNSKINSPYVQDYYTDMIQSDYNDDHDEASSTFETLLSSGMVWADFQRGAKVTACAFSPPPPPLPPQSQYKNSASQEDKLRHPLFLAVGCDDGSLSVVELLDHVKSLKPNSSITSSASVTSSASSHASSSSHKRSKYGPVRELPREGKIRSLHFSPDARYLLVAGDDCTAAVVHLGWDQHHHNLTHGIHSSLSLQNHLHAHKHQSSPDNGSTPFQSNQNQLSSYKGIPGLPPLAVVAELEREDRVYAAQWSPCGTLIAVGGFDGMVAIASFLPPPPDTNKRKHNPISDSISSLRATLELIAEIPRLGLILSLHWSPDGNMLAIGGSDKRAAVVHVYASQNSDTSTNLAHAAEHNDDFEYEHNTSNIIHNDHSHDEDEDMDVIHEPSSPSSTTNTNAWEVVGEIQRTASVQCVQWSPDGSCLAVGGQDGVVAIVDISTRSILNEVHRKRSKTTFQKCVTAAASAPPTNDSSPSAPPTTAVRINSLCWSPDGMFLAIAGNDDKCVIMEMKTFVAVQEIKRSASVNSVVWGHQYPCGGAAGGRYLAIGGDDRTVALLKTGADDDASTHYSSDMSESDTDCNSSISSVASSHTGDWIFEEGSFRDMDEDAVNKSNLASEPVSIHNVVFSHLDVDTQMSEYMAVSGSDCRVVVLSTYDWVVITEMTYPKPIYTLQFSKDNEYLALGGVENVAYVISVDTWEIISETHTSSSILTMGFSQKNERLALGLADGVLSLLDPDTNTNWEIIGEMDENDSPILSLDWSTNEKYLALGRNDSTLTIHESQSVLDNFFMPETELIRGGGAPVYSLRFGVEGKFLAVGRGDWTVGIFSNNKGGWALCHQLKMDGWILSVGWSADGRYLGVGGNDITQGGTVYDTISWNVIEDLGGDKTSRGIGVGEETTSVGWSGDGRFFVAAGKGGVSRVICTKSWKLLECVDHISQNGEETETPTVPSTEELPESAKLPVEKAMEAMSLSPVSDSDHKELPLAISHNLCGAWEQRSIINRFLELCEVFLNPFEVKEPPETLRFFVPSIMMLRVHVTWVGTMNEKTLEKVETQDDHELLLSLLGIIKIAVSVISRILEDKDIVQEWWEEGKKFNLTPKDIRRIKAWNDYWQRVDEDAPVVDTNLLSLCD